MAEHQSTAANGRSPKSRPLIGIFYEEDGQTQTRYFTDEVEARAFADSKGAHEDQAGAWADLDWDETEAALDRIRHAVPPIPPIDLDDL